MFENLERLLRRGLVGGRVIARVAAARVFDVLAARGAIADARRHEYHEALLHEVPGIVAVALAAHLLEIIGPRRAAVVEDEERGLRDGVVAEHRHLERTRDGAAGVVAGGAR